MNGWAIGGESPFLLHTEDGGATWSLLKKEEIKLPGFLTGICFVDQQTGWVSGWSAAYPNELMIKHTIDGGETWENQNYSSAWLIGRIRVYFINQLEGWVSAGDLIIHSTDGGVT